jgi:site-specific DNA recombinase
MKTPPPAPATKKEVGIWIRVSTEDQARGDSPKHHEMRARAYAESRDWIVCEVYDLAGVSGKSIADHPETKRMMEDVRTGHIQALVFSKLARLARNTRELLDFADFFQKQGADLISLQESIDTSTPAGRLFYTMIAAMAQWEREEIADRVRATVHLRAKSGKPITGRLAFGYYYHEGKIQPHPDEGPVRKLIYELFAEHGRKKRVARLLNERGLRTRAGKLFTDSTLDYLIRDPAAKGEYQANYTRMVANNKVRGQKPEHEWVVTQVEPIISKELWEQCNNLLDKRKASLTRRPGAKALHPFAGYVICQCGTKMYVGARTPKYVCEKCRTKIPIIDLDSLFHEQLAGYLMSPEKAAEYVNSAGQFIADKVALLESLNAELRKVKEEGEKVFQLYYDGGLTAEQFKVKYAPIDTRRGQLEAEIPKAEAHVAAAKVDGLSAEQIIADGRNVHNRWPLMTPDEKRHIVELLVNQIVVKPDEIDINLCYKPSFEEITKRQRRE